jgi:CDK-activating kinase assembly factor MAT1
LPSTKEDNLFKKDIEVRKQVLAVYNKVQSDFASIDDYDEYLISIEDLIDTLISGNEK